MKSYYKSAKARLSFFLHKNPRIEEPRKDFRKFVPEPYQGVVIISADFELAWAWRFDKKSNNPLDNCLKLAKQERENIPEILRHSTNHKIPITWGTVGHLFLEQCQHGETQCHSELKRIPYFENEWWKYNKGDWFDMDPASSVEESPEWYAPDLIRSILGSSVKHEIACHSFSHISCTDEHCPPQVLVDELAACAKAAKPFGVKLESYIFPGHTMGNYDTLRSCGYTSMRSNFINVLGYPEQHQNGIWEHKTTMELYFNPLFSVPHNIKRYKYIINKSIRNHQVCNLWFHPSFGKTDLEIIMPGVFKILDEQRDKLWITTMKEYTAWLNGQSIGYNKKSIA